MYVHLPKRMMKPSYKLHDAYNMYEVYLIMLLINEVRRLKLLQVY